MTQETPVEVYYDGSCPVCDREMRHYRELDIDEKFRFIDISAPNFAAREGGPSYEDFMARLHVRDAEGRFHTGVDAFAVIWRTLPGRMFTLMARLVQLPGIHAVASLGYMVFARLRPYLPKRRRCEDDSCSWHSSR